MDCVYVPQLLFRSSCTLPRLTGTARDLVLSPCDREIVCSQWFTSQFNSRSGNTAATLDRYGAVNTSF